MINLIQLNPIETKTAAQEGLPFWLFWLLIALIGLLSLFIFLRDKDLRRKIDFFFLGAKNRSLQIHLRRQIMREKKKKESLWLELGRIVYELKLAIDGAEAIFRSLDSLEKKKQQIVQQLNHLQNNLKTIQTKPFSASPIEEGLNSNLTLNSSASSIVEMIDEKDSLKLKAAWQRKRSKLEEKIKDLDEQANGFLITLGRITDTLRFKNEKLTPFYEKIDSINIKISHLEQRLDSLHPF